MTREEERERRGRKGGREGEREAAAGESSDIIYSHSLNSQSRGLGSSSPVSSMSGHVTLRPARLLPATAADPAALAGHWQVAAGSRALVAEWKLMLRRQP